MHYSSSYSTNADYQAESIIYSSSDNITVKYKSSYGCGRGCNPCINCKNM